MTDKLDTVLSLLEALRAQNERQDAMLQKLLDERPPGNVWRRPEQEEEGR